VPASEFDLMLDDDLTVRSAATSACGTEPKCAAPRVKAGYSFKADFGGQRH
jgi:hypothetical protein